MPSLFKQLGEVRQREIEAVESVFRHDDGLRVGDLPRAEVVLVGASRTMETPTTHCYACRALFTVNGPLVPEIPVPATLRPFPASRASSCS
jgi:regulator of PEP synthase PpsR (kinase-PPPase family)